MYCIICGSRETKYAGSYIICVRVVVTSGHAMS